MNDTKIKPADRRARICADIAPLAYLGRTDRWRNAIYRWEGEMAKQPAEALEWAFLQYYILAGHAAR